MGTWDHSTSSTKVNATVSKIRTNHFMALKSGIRICSCVWKSKRDKERHRKGGRESVKWEREYSCLKLRNLNQAISFIILDRIVMASFESHICHFERTLHIIVWADAWLCRLFSECILTELLMFTYIHECNKRENAITIIRITLRVIIVRRNICYSSVLSMNSLERSLAYAHNLKT